MCFAKSFTINPFLHCCFHVFVEGTYLVFSSGEFMLGLVLQINSQHGPIRGSHFFY